MWQWWNYAVSRVPAGKDVLKLNLDETSVCLFQGGAKGTLMVSQRRLGDRPREPVQHASPSNRRACLTHIGLICNRPDLQRVLPQVIIGNERTFSAGDWAALQAACPCNVFLVRQKSAWNSSELMVRVITLLASVLAPYMREVQPVLLMDACKVHIARAVLEACVKSGIWPVVVPAKMTWLLQPCDTHAFLKLKTRLKIVSYPKARARAGASDGSLSVAEFLEALYDAIRVALVERRWEGAFVQDGYGRDQAWLAKHTLRQLEYEQPPEVPCAQPSIEQLQLCFPKGAAVPQATLFKPFQALALPAAPAAKAAPIAKARLMAPRRPAVLASAARLGLPPPEAAAAPLRDGPMTRSQSRLIAALAKGRPLLGPSGASGSASSGSRGRPRS